MPNMPNATALLALWNDVTPDVEADYNEWHAQEHVPERLTVPGMLWARRYLARPRHETRRYLTLYGLLDVQVLQSEPYLRLLREPTPESARMRPHLLDLRRWVCDVRGGSAPPEFEPIALRTARTRVALEEGRALPGDANALIAERRDDSAPLPWLGAGQSAPEDSPDRWLLATMADGRYLVGAREADGMILHDALPIGPPVAPRA